MASRSKCLDLDHDLGDFANQGGDAIKLLGLVGGAGDLLSRGDPYSEPRGQSKYGERARRGTGERSTGKDINRVGADSSHSWITGLNGSSLDGCA
ncbi:MAG: hypothetical protein ACLTAX_14075 [Waltera sp.]